MAVVAGAVAVLAILVAMLVGLPSAQAPGAESAAQDEIYRFVAFCLFLAVVAAMGVASRRLVLPARKPKLGLVFVPERMKIGDAAGFLGRNVVIRGEVAEPIVFALHDPRAKIRVSDDTGKIDVSVWDKAVADEVKKKVRQGTPLVVEGYLESFRGAPTINVSGMGHRILVLPERVVLAAGAAQVPMGRPPPEEPHLPFLSEEERRLLFPPAASGAREELHGPTKKPKKGEGT